MKADDAFPALDNQYDDEVEEVKAAETPGGEVEPDTKA